MKKNHPRRPTGALPTPAMGVLGVHTTVLAESPGPVEEARTAAGACPPPRWLTATLASVGALWLSCAVPVDAFTLFDHHIPAPGTGCGGSFGYAYSDILAHPDDHWSWDLTPIYYVFDPSFDLMFPDPRIKDQVRFALEQWDTADMTPCGTRDDYLRNTTVLPPHNFIDIRTVTVHEVGHVLGLGHPPAGAAIGRNYRGPACEGSLSVHSNTGREVMHNSIGPGWYNHILSWDELEALDFGYHGLNLDFIEAGPGDPVSLVFQTYFNSSSLNIARGRGMGALRNTSVPLDGSEVTTATVCFNVNCAEPIGFRQHGFNWDMIASVDTHRVVIRTRGTDNTMPAAVWRNQGPHEFNTVTHTLFGADQKDDITHRWTNPTSDVPAGTLFHVGLVLDVWDWTVVSALAFDAMDNPSVLPLTVGHEWHNEVVASASSTRAPAADEDTFIPRPGKVTARGFTIVASEAPFHRLSDLRLGVVSGMGLTLADLNRETLKALENVIRPIQNFGERELMDGQEFVVVFDGDERDLPPDLRESGRYLLLHQPELADEEVFAYWQSDNQETRVGNFGLLGERPIIASRCVPSISITLRGENVIISFTGVLETARQPTGPWSPVPGADSPLIVPATGPQRFYRAVCAGAGVACCEVDFQTFAVGAHPNPWQLGGCRFRLVNPPSPNNSIQIQGPFRGLDCGRGYLIQLDHPTSLVETALLSLAQGAKLTAVDPAGVVVDTVNTANVATPQTLTLMGPDIVEVLIDAPQNEVWMLKFRCE